MPAASTPGDDVLDGPREKVSVMREPCRERRTVVEAEHLAVFPLGKRPLEDILFLPVLLNPTLKVGKRLLGVDGVEHCEEMVPKKC